MVAINFEEEGINVAVSMVEQGTQNKPSQVIQKIIACKKNLSQLKTDPDMPFCLTGVN